MTAAEMRKALAEVMGEVPVFPRQSHYYYPRGLPNPNHDRSFVSRVGTLLILNFGRKVHVQEVLGTDPWTVHEAVEYLRQIGFVIAGERGVPGYTLLRWQRPEARRTQPASQPRLEDSCA